MHTDIDGARWHRAEPRRALAVGTLQRVLDCAQPGKRMVAIEALTEGLRNSNFRVELDGGESVVLRLYEHDASICQKEMDLLQLVRGRVASPEVLYAAPEGVDGVAPFALLRWVEGLTFRELSRGGDAAAIGEAAFAAGQTLAAIGEFRFDRGGWIGPGLQVGAPLMEGADPVPRFVEACLESETLQQRVAVEVRDRVREFVWRHGADYARMDGDARLVHCDFNRRNLIVREEVGRWRVAAVLDWEFAVSASPLIDMGNFLRYERGDEVEQRFSEGFVDGGGELPDDWRLLARLMDLTAICDALTHSGLPASAAAELAGMLP